MQDLEGASQNYKSYEEDREIADELFKKEVDKGFVEWSKEKVSLDKKFGRWVPSAIGLIVKHRLDGSVKARLVHDLRRSGINSHIVLKERLVLPRLKDAVEDALTLLEVAAPHEQIEFMTLDFSDAFKQLPVLHNEKKYLSGQALGGFFVYHKVLFGIKTGPLVWGRVAALVARATQSLLDVDRARLQIFVDDPLLVMRGTAHERNFYQKFGIELVANCRTSGGLEKGHHGH